MKYWKQQKSKSGRWCGQLFKWNDYHVKKQISANKLAKFIGEDKLSVQVTLVLNQTEVLRLYAALKLASTARVGVLESILSSNSLLNIFLEFGMLNGKGRFNYSNCTRNTSTISTTFLSRIATGQLYRNWLHLTNFRRSKTVLRKQNTGLGTIGDVHWEFVYDLSIQTCIACIRRYSDNGRNLVGAESLFMINRPKSIKSI